MSRRPFVLDYLANAENDATILRAVKLTLITSLACLVVGLRLATASPKKGAK